MLVGQNPGTNEDLYGKPFVGQAGRYLDSLLFSAGIPRESVCVTNIVKCLTPHNRAITPAEIASCSPWLDIEVNLVAPRIIVAMGAATIYHFLGAGSGTVEHLHGKPIEKDGRIILPAYHPAAALHNPTLLRQCSDDFQVLRGLAKGASWRDYHVMDEYPDPCYEVADTPAKIKQMVSQINDAGEFAVDTETCRGRLWSAQFSACPGTAWFLPISEEESTYRVDLTGYQATAIVHFYLHDVQYLRIADDRFMDTMSMSYHLGLPQGLKELASRLCGIQMVNYNEVVRPVQEELSLEYLLKAACKDLPAPPETEETKWNNKKGELVTRKKKPWHISRKIKSILDDYAENPLTDLWDRWRSIPGIERSALDRIMGPMPQASLMDIPFPDAVRYAARDADATLRVYYKLLQLIQKMDLDFVLNMDLRVLPMASSMMQNGMAVDLEHYRKLSEDYDIRMRVQAAELAGEVGHAFNPASSDQVAAVVYGELGFKPTAFTPTKEVSTDDSELKKTKHPVAQGIIQYRGLLKLKTTYADNMIRSAHPDTDGVPRIHTVIKTTRVETGRWSSAKNDDGEGANLQNIPTRNTESKAIKNGFIAPLGKVLAEGDLAQIEMVCLAHLSNCKRLVELFLRGGDPHTEMAATVFGVSLEEAAQSKYRYPVKRLNFGIAYLIGPQGLSNQIQEYISDLKIAGEPVEIEPWDVPTCEKFIAEWYRLNPEVKDFQLEMAAMARRYGYVNDIFGRMRYIPEITCPIRSVQEAGARQAANLPVTASAQGILKMAMWRLWEQLPYTEWADQVRFLMQIHDSLVMEITDNKDIYKSYLRWMDDIVRNVVYLRVPVKMDYKVGKRWGELVKVKLS